MTRSQTKKTRAKQSSSKALTVVVIVVIVLFAGYLITQPGKDAVSPITVPASSTQSPQTTTNQTQAKGEVTFLDIQGTAKAKVTVEIADNEQSRALGLMYRPAMGRSYGMLFVFDSANVQSFWMKNTILSLDMIFVSAEGEIVTIHKNTTPYSDRAYVSAKPSLYVVEVNAGFSDEHKLREGDKMKWKIIEKVANGNKYTQ